jgi:putative tRNA adenosine deaminase-associated protein
VAYFTAVLVREGDKWFARADALAAFDTLEELADAMRVIEADDAEPALAFIEREDLWWAIVRVDGDEDPRVFVSDTAGALASTYADLLAVEADEDATVAAGACSGDFDILADLGTTPDGLQEMCDDELLPMDALATVAEAGGFAEVLDSLR